MILVMIRRHKVKNGLKAFIKMSLDIYDIALISCDQTTPCEMTDEMLPILVAFRVLMKKQV